MEPREPFRSAAAKKSKKVYENCIDVQKQGGKKKKATAYVTAWKDAGETPLEKPSSPAALQSLMHLHATRETEGKRNGIRKKEGKQTLSIWRPRADGERSYFAGCKHLQTSCD
jgi:hypothetical protein